MLDDPRSHLRGDRAPGRRAREGGQDETPPIPELIGESAAMRDVYRLTRQVADSDASVLLLGETGTGKELIARAIHQLSPRGSGPFVRVNCGALAESLLESELFGHVRGAFTGAVENRTGRFEAAHTGSIFLDEIDSTTAKLQVKLLRVLQEHEFERVGDTKTVCVDVRVIAASNRDLLEEVEQRRFREDLYYRLNVVTIYLPPLRERREDIPLLVGHFLRFYNEKNRRHVPHISAEAMEALKNYDWPGNVRELQNYIERAVVLARGDEIGTDLLPHAVLGRRGPRLGSRRRTVQSIARDFVDAVLAEADPEASDIYDRMVGELEREMLAQVLERCRGIQIKAAAWLGMNRNTLHKKLRQYGLADPKEPEDSPRDASRVP